MVIALVATLVALELTLAVTLSSVGKPLDRLFRLLAEQSDGTFLHRLRPGGIASLARAAARLTDNAAHLAARLRALPTELRDRAHGLIQRPVSKSRPSSPRASTHTNAP